MNVQWTSVVNSCDWMPGAVCQSHCELFLLSYLRVSERRRGIQADSEVVLAEQRKKKKKRRCTTKNEKNSHNKMGEGRWKTPVSFYHLKVLIYHIFTGQTEKNKNKFIPQIKLKLEKMHCTHTFIWNMDNKTTVCFYDPCQLLLRRPRSLIMIVLFICHLQ